MSPPDRAAVLDLAKWPTAEKFVSRCDTRQGPRDATQPRLRAGQRLLRRLLHVHQAGPRRGVGRRDGDNGAALPAGPDLAADGADALSEHHDGVHGRHGRAQGRRRRAARAVPPAPVRRNQLRRAAGRGGRAQGHAGLAGRRVDVTGAGDAPLPGGQGRAAGGALLFAGGQDLVRGDAGDGAAALRVSVGLAGGRWRRWIRLGSPTLGQ
ncbi:hypothetical protein VFPBJ_10408 [Purpureocillium lilacinum]|uniref:Uncharacterized protein n=1 Tax=Purpureocillium lilacinum TaxID=33203 RepID=A0A179G390_PURLI|nr:hypothetical protein VFPBJ_10408 [Purpureocillium lilacinum]